MRVLLVLIVFCLPLEPSGAATLDAWQPTENEVSDTAGRDAFDILLAAHDQSYRDTPGAVPAPWPDIAVRVLLLAGYALALAACLPRSRLYAARAASAISRMRRTIARRPFER